MDCITFHNFSDIIYLHTKSLLETGIVMLTVPLSVAGAFWALYLLGYNLSIAVWVGIIALAGVIAELGVVTILYFVIAYKDQIRKGRMRTKDDLIKAIHQGAFQRVRPTIMTAVTITAGIVPIMWSHGAGADTMKRVAAPMIGGVVTTVVIQLLIFPAIYFIWKVRYLEEEGDNSPGGE